MSDFDDLLHHKECIDLLDDFKGEDLDSAKHLILISINCDGGWTMRATPSLTATSYFGVLKLCEAQFIADNL